MMDGKMTSKVTPYDIHVPPPKENNFVNNSINLIRRVRFLLIVQMMLGINRIYLLRWNVVISILCYIYNFILVGLTMYLMVTDDSKEGFYVIFKQTNCVEYLILVIASNLFQRNCLLSMFQDLANFDDMLNITKEAAQTIQIQRTIVWISTSIIYSVLEYVISYMSGIDISNAALLIYITISAHDSEQIFFVTLIRTIMIRVRVLKGHIDKTFNVNKDVNTNSENEKIEALSNKVQLDTFAMHRAYELLHKCAEQLNSVMSFQMIVMLFTSGLSTTMLLKKFFQVTQETNSSDPYYRAVAVYMAVRCCKYTALVIIPCYYASATAREVTHIRTMLHNAVNTFKMDKLQRRKLKAFFQLAKDNEFSYALWGVIRLSMSLPLSYASLCTTYLVISIQFSKFID